MVGKGFAVLQSGRINMAGFMAWLIWASVHLQFLATPGLRMSVLLQWIWTFVTSQRGSRLIVNYHAPAPVSAALDEAINERPEASESIRPRSAA